MNNQARQVDYIVRSREKAPECLGAIPKNYSPLCSAKCRLTSLCVLIAMGDFLRGQRQ
jgi:hypothetical protein